MDFSRFVPSTNVPVPSCGEMEGACYENARFAERWQPISENKALEAHDAIVAWVAALGKLEEEKRKRTLNFWKEQVMKHAEDLIYWKARSQSWRECMSIHPELVSEEVGARCSHGYIAPMCVIDKPSVKRDREPGEDDGDLS